MAKTQKIKNKKKPNFRAIATTILLLAIVLFSYSASRFLDEVKLIKEYNERAIGESNDATFSAISGLINSICISAEDSLQDNLKIAGNTLPKDEINIVLQTLNGDDNTAFKSKKISNIFFKDYYFTHIKNSNNDIFICNENGIIADYSQNNESDIYKFVPWDMIGSEKDYPNIKGEVLEKILDCKDLNPIIYEINGDGTLYDMDYLKKIYIEYGVEEFKNYGVLVPAYIDRLGASTKNYDLHCDNYSVIIVQEFNIYDQLMYMQPDIGKHSSTGFSEEEMDEIITVLHMLGFCLFIGDVIFIIIMIHIHNGYILKKFSDNTKRDD